VDGGDLAAEGLHAEGGHCVADITWDGLAIGSFFLDEVVLESGLPGCDLVILSAAVRDGSDLGDGSTHMAGNGQDVRFLLLLGHVVKF